MIFFLHHFCLSIIYSSDTSKRAETFPPDSVTDNLEDFPGIISVLAKSDKSVSSPCGSSQKKLQKCFYSAHCYDERCFGIVLSFCYLRNLQVRTFYPTPLFLQGTFDIKVVGTSKLQFTSHLEIKKS